MKPSAAFVLASSVLLASCNSGGVDGISASDQRAIDARAASNVECIFEDHQLCAQLIDKRTAVAQFFSPVQSKNLKELQKKQGKQSLTARIVDAAASIRQCNKTDAVTDRKSVV